MLACLTCGFREHCWLVPTTSGDWKYPCGIEIKAHEDFVSTFNQFQEAWTHLNKEGSKKLDRMYEIR